MGSHHLYTKKQVQTRIRQCCGWKHMLQNNLSFLKIVIVDDENWKHHFDLLTKSATNVWKHTDSPLSKRKKTTHQICFKVMIDNNLSASCASKNYSEG